MSSLTRAMIDDILPDGPAWEPEEGGDLDDLLDGIADNYEVIRAFLSELSDLRNPNKTSILSDLEREYGFETNLLLSEATRRQRLAEFIYGASKNGTENDLQSALRSAGFDVYVYQNDPAVDPAIFLDQSFQMVAGGSNAYAGRSDAFAGRLGGELLVNGDIYKTSRIFTSVAGSGFYAGTGHGAGEYEDLLIEKLEYTIPTDPADWPLVFFVGGAATLGYIELLVNGGFETGDFTGWTQNSAAIDNTNPASGTWCSKLDTATGTIGADSDVYDINPRQIYTIAVKNDVTSITAGTYRVAVTFYDANGAALVERGGISIFSTTSATAGYEQTIKTIGPSDSGADIIYPAGTAKLSILQWFDPASTGVGFMDDVELYRSDKQSIISIGNATVDGAREDEFKRTILQYKPLHSWAALIVNFA